MIVHLFFRAGNLYTWKNRGSIQGSVAQIFRWTSSGERSEVDSIESLPNYLERDFNTTLAWGQLFPAPLTVEGSWKKLDSSKLDRSWTCIPNPPVVLFCGHVEPAQRSAKWWLYIFRSPYDISELGHRGRFQIDSERKSQHISFTNSRFSRGKRGMVA